MSLALTAIRRPRLQSFKTQGPVTPTTSKCSAVTARKPGSPCCPGRSWPARSRNDVSFLSAAVSPETGAAPRYQAGCTWMRARVKNSSSWVPLPFQISFELKNQCMIDRLIKHGPTWVLKLPVGHGCSAPESAVLRIPCSCLRRAFISPWLIVLNHALLSLLGSDFQRTPAQPL